MCYVSDGAFSTAMRKGLEIEEIAISSIAPEEAQREHHQHGARDRGDEDNHPHDVSVPLPSRAVRARLRAVQHRRALRGQLWAVLGAYA